MTDQELRQLVREAIARVGAGAAAGEQMLARPAPRTLASFGLLNLPDGAETGGCCIIEPAVSCNHCGYCKSYGH